jgi:hypothetical protein
MKRSFFRRENLLGFSFWPVAVFMIGLMSMVLVSGLDLHKVPPHDFLTRIWPSVIAIAATLGACLGLLDRVASLTEISYREPIVACATTAGGMSLFGWTLWQLWFLITSSP